jgi:hypothetical protein
LFVGSPWTRQSWIAISADSAPGGRKVIKDQYHARGRRFDEAEIFDILQGGDVGGPAVGCVLVQSHGDVDGVFTADLQSPRQKRRIVMTTVGKPLYDCPSVFQFLKVMYDALEGTELSFQIFPNLTLFQRTAGYSKRNASFTGTSASITFFCRLQLLRLLISRSDPSSSMRSFTLSRPLFSPESFPFIIRP